MARLSLDSGLLIGLDRGDDVARAWFRRAFEAEVAPVVSTVAVAEAWRDGRAQARLARFLKVCLIVPVDEALARTAGQALAVVPGAGAADALIAATAARAGALLVTADLDDLQRLADGCFRSLRLASIR